MLDNQLFMVDFCFVQIDEILSLIPTKVLDDLAGEMGVNKYAKKLRAQVVFKLLIYCILSYKDNSLRMMESVYETIGFGLINSGSKNSTIRYSSISEKLSKLDYRYFEKLYYICVETFGGMIKQNGLPLIRFDSTIISLSSKLLHSGYNLPGDSRTYNQVKISIGFSELPEFSDIYTEQQAASENYALKKTMFGPQAFNQRLIKVFDRGVSARNTFDQMVEEGTAFITRIRPKSKHVEVIGNSLDKAVSTQSLTIYSDRWISLFAEGGKKSEHPLRCIQGIQKETEEPIWFITNIADLSAEEITGYYKRRWDIETFFKFIKQELNFGHFINRSENGMKTIIYCTLIASIILLAYKKKTNQKGYKIVKLRLLNELEKSMARQFTIMMGGDPEKFDTLFNNSS
ncbi:MAG: IS4 family transposase [Chitinophagales bacterium]